MKPKYALRNFLALAGSSILAVSSASAGTLYWDGNDTTGNADGGLGNWDNLLTNWDTTGVAGANSAWTAGDTAVFSGTGAIVTLTDDITVGGLAFNKVNGGTTYYTINSAINSKTLSFSSGDNYIRMNIGNGGAPTATFTGEVAGTGANVIIAPQNIVASGGGGNFGTVIFNGTSTGGWTGATTINAAANVQTVSTASLTNRVLANTSGITLNGGTLQFTRASNSNIDAISNGAIGVNGGGTFSVTSSAGGVSAIENIGTVTVNSGQMNFVQTANNANQLVLGGLGRGSSTTSAVTFSSAGFGTARFAVTGSGTTSGWTDAAASNSIIGAWATTGSTAALQTDYAVYNGGFVTAANTAATAETSWSDAAKQYTLSYATKTATALTATRNIAALKVSTPIASVSTAVLIGSPTFTVASGHSFAVNDPVVIGTAPGGFVPGRVYYVESATGTTFTLSATPGGSAINATSNVTATFAGGLKLDSGINLGTTGILNSGAAPIGIGRTAAGGQISLPTAGAGNLFMNAGSGNIGIDAPIVDNGGALTLVKTGNSILNLSNNNTFTGGLVVNAGTVRLTGDQTITGGVTLNGGSLGDLTDGISAAEIDSNSVSVNGNAAMVITAGETLASDIAINSTGFLRVAATTSGTLSGVVSGTGVLTNSSTGAGNGTITLSNTANTHTGVVSIVSDNNQPFTLAVNSLADSAGAGNIQMGGGGTLGGHTFALHSGAIAPLILNHRQVELVGDGSPSVTFKLSNNSTQAFTINTDLLASGTNVKTLTLGGSGAGLSTFGGTITNGNHTTLNLAKVDAASTWNLTNTANTYNGTTTVSAGTLGFASGALGSTGTINASGGTLRWLTGNTQDISSRLLMTTATTTTLNTNGNNVTFANAIGTGTSALVKAGLGTLTLQGQNTYTGATTVNGGILQLQSGGSNLTQTLGTLALAGADATLISNVSGAGNLSTTFTTLTARVAGNTGNIVTTGIGAGTNSINLTQAAGFIDKGVYFNGADFAAMNGLNTYVRALAYGTDPNAVAVGTITAARHIKLTSTPGTQAAISLLSLNLSGSGVSWTTTSGNLTVPGIIKSGGGSASTISGGNLTTASNAELVIRTDTSSDSLAISSNLTQGSGALTKSGAGTLTLSGNNDYTGQTFVNSGVLSIGANINLGRQTTGAQLNLRGGTLQATGTFGLFNGTAGTNNRAVVLTDSAGFDVTSSNTLTVAGVVSGTGSLTKSNNGTLTLTNTNTYTGATTVTGGTLLVNGNISTSVLTTVQTGATLGGSGSVGALTIDSGGFFSPGNSPGIETVNGAYTQNGTLQIEIEGGTAGNGAGFHDQVIVNGTVTLNGLLDLMAFSGTHAANDLIFILLNDGSDAITGTFTGLAQGADVGTYAGLNWQISYTGNSGGSPSPTFTGGNDIVLMAIPEPGAALLGSFGFLLLFRRRR